ncbi:MAG: M48 family metallopeptidase [Lentisphaerota bacterium]
MKLFNLIVIVTGLVSALVLTSCETMDALTELGTSVGVATGTINSNQAKSINRSAAAVAKTFSDITPEQEYYIGRSVAATVLKTYKPLNKDEANRYLNQLGQSLAQFSDRPETFGGYHFLVMESDEINAFSAPGGFVMISRGLIRCCDSEDALAAVLAHEIGHVEKKHGLRAIKTGRLTSALTTLGMEGAKSFGGQQLADLTTAFEGSITDVCSTMMNSGYARNLEFEADQAAVTIMRRTGYNPEALITMLEQMQKNLVPGRHDFAATHPPPEMRIEKVRNAIGSQSAVKEPTERQKRFAEAVGKI